MVGVRFSSTQTSPGDVVECMLTMPCCLEGVGGERACHAKELLWLDLQG